MLTVTQVLGKYADFSKIKPEVLRAACDRGTNLHACISGMFEDLWSKEDPAIAGYLQSFKRWREEFVVETALVEKRLISEKWGYSGKIDWVGRMRGDNKLRVIDWKSPLVGTLIHKLQVAAYRNLAIENGYDIGEAGCLYLKKNGDPAIFKSSDNQIVHFQIFLHALWSHRGILGEGGKRE